MVEILKGQILCLQRHIEVTQIHNDVLRIVCRNCRCEWTADIQFGQEQLERLVAYHCFDYEYT